MNIENIFFILKLNYLLKKYFDHYCPSINSLLSIVYFQFIFNIKNKISEYLNSRLLILLRAMSCWIFFRNINIL